MRVRVLRTSLMKVRPDDMFFLGMAAVAVLAVLSWICTLVFPCGHVVCAASQFTCAYPCCRVS